MILVGHIISRSLFSGWCSTNARFWYSICNLLCYALCLPLFVTDVFIMRSQTEELVFLIISFPLSQIYSVFYFGTRINYNLLDLTNITCLYCLLYMCSFRNTGNEIPIIILYTVNHFVFGFRGIFLHVNCVSLNCLMISVSNIFVTMCLTYKET